VDRLVGEHGWTEELAIHGVIARWDQIVGAEIAAHVRTERYAKGELIVRADSTAWATQLRMMRSELLQAIAQRHPEAGVETIRFQGPDAPTWKRGPRSVPGRGPRDTYG
jgi:predicted nucleic acid-binding Zn ribbon protein